MRVPRPEWRLVFPVAVLDGPSREGVRSGGERFPDTFFAGAVQEVFAVAVLRGRRYPDLINDDEKLLENSFLVPTECLGEVAAS